MRLTVFEPETGSYLTVYRSHAGALAGETIWILLTPNRANRYT